MGSVQALIDETLGHLLSLEREEQNKTATTVSATDTTLTFQYDLSAVQPGSYISYALELMRVWEVNESNKTAVVERGQLGSTAAAIVAGAVVTVNPKFPQFRILQQLNSELRSLPGEGLFRMTTVDLTSVAGQYGYNLTNVTDMLDVYKVAWAAPGTEQFWPRIRDYTVERQASTTDFASGFGIIVKEAPYPGVVLRVWYKAPFTELSTLGQDVASASGLPASALDILTLGASARIMAAREAKRSFTESQADTRRATEVGSGAASRSAAALLSLRTERISSEINRLHAQWPPLR